MMPDVEHFNQNRGIYSPVVAEEGLVLELGNRSVFGTWMMGNDYRNKSPYYGTYPPSYLKRMRLLFPDSEKVLHLFSGMVERGFWQDETTFDIKPELQPDIQGDAENLATYSHQPYTLILADPPYEDNHLKYGTQKVNKRKVVSECSKILVPGGHLVWLDTTIPMWSKADEWVWAGSITILQSTNHRVRVATILRKNSAEVLR